MFLEKLDLEGKVILVTGAGRGLGRAMSLALARAGAHIVAAARTVTQLEQVVNVVPSKHGWARLSGGETPP